MGSSEGIREVVAPALSSIGLELWDVETAKDVVRVLVDRPGGIDVDSLAAASGAISPILDQRPDLTPAGRYQLEVSSPGVERTLRHVEQYRRYIGSEVNVKTTCPVEGSRRHHGTLLDVEDRAIRVQSRDAGPDAVVELRFDQIDRARTVVVWGAAGPPRSPRRGAAKQAASTPTASGVTASGVTASAVTASAVTASGVTALFPKELET